MADIDKKEVGNRIRSIRNELGYTLKEFGERLSQVASDSIVSRWERGVSIPNSKRLSDIAFFGQMSVNELLHGKYCEWKVADDNTGIYSTQCDEYFEVISPTLSDNKIKYCCYCGKRLKVVN